MAWLEPVVMRSRLRTEKSGGVHAASLHFVEDGSRSLCWGQGGSKRKKFSAPPLHMVPRRTRRGSLPCVPNSNPKTLAAGMLLRMVLDSALLDLMQLQVTPSVPIFFLKLVIFSFTK